MRRYKTVATGGTFDQIHPGHRSLLAKSFEVGDRVVIGLTSDDFVRKEGKAAVHMYPERLAQLRRYLEANFTGRDYLIAKLDDTFGPGIAQADVEALVASPETAKKVDLANRLRQERGFAPLELVVIDWALAEDGKPISSTRIRKGEIDAEGRLKVGREP